MKNVIVNIDKRHSVATATTTSVKERKPIGGAVIYALLFIAIGGAIGFFYNTTIVPGITNLPAIAIPMGGFALAGLLFSAFLYTGLRFLSKSNYSGGITYALIVFAGVFAALFIMGTIKGNGSVTTSLFYSSLFILPFTIHQSWLLYSRILFFSYKKIWYLPEQSALQTKRATIFLNSIHIKVKIPSIQDGPEYMYETTVPGRMSVGEMFNDVVSSQISIEDYDDAFEEINKGNYGWQFFVPSLLGLSNRMVDAETSLDKNKIKNNGVVIARRIPKQLAIIETINQN